MAGSFGARSPFAPSAKFSDMNRFPNPAQCPLCRIFLMSHGRGQGQLPYAPRNRPSLMARFFCWFWGDGVHDRAWGKVTVQRSTKGSLSLHNIAAFRGERERELLAQKLPSRNFMSVPSCFSGGARGGSFWLKSLLPQNLKKLKKGVDKSAV